MEMEDTLEIRQEEKSADLLAAIDRACEKIAPVWPLDNFVAVNPYLGLSSHKFESAAQKLAAVGGIQMTLPFSFYLEKLKEGILTAEDLKEAAQRRFNVEIEVDELLDRLAEVDDQQRIKASTATVVDVATRLFETDWNRFMIARISSWAASYFDAGQAEWKAADADLGIFAAWKAEAGIDRSPEIMGLSEFRESARNLPQDPADAAKVALKILGVPGPAVDTYLHRLLLKVGGWSAYAARLDWDRKLNGQEPARLREFLAVLLSWEACLFQSLKSRKLKEQWRVACKRLQQPDEAHQMDENLRDRLIFQEAFERASQRSLVQRFSQDRSLEPQAERRPKAQAVFCIDVRSEVFRRNLELVDQEVDTIGFAGFFGFPINYHPLAHEGGEAQCPVLIPAGPSVREVEGDERGHQQAYEKRILGREMQKLLKSFKTGAVSCFSFVSPLGLSFLPKLFTDSFGLTRPVKQAKRSDKVKISLESFEDNGNHFGIPMEDRVAMARNALTAMSLTQNFAQFVLIAGHGSSSVNNPHASGLDCGACGGRSGEYNARVAAMILNDRAVRKALAEDEIHIPEDTCFLAGLHDTTTDEVKILNPEDVAENRKKALFEFQQALSRAGQTTRTERAVRMAITDQQDKAVKRRANDWSQVRPEWGLAGCSAFVVAPREKTRGINLQGQSFLHSYDWKSDRGFKVLETIMTAPMVVTSWINLQYYASAVDNKVFGSGNKTLHNVTAGVGVLEGYSGDLRVGLPIQSVHDGAKFQHEPIRLNVIIDAPMEAMNGVLEKHADVRNLCDNGWIHLLAMNAEGKVSHRYVGDYKWESINAMPMN